MSVKTYLAVFVPSRILSTASTSLMGFLSGRTGGICSSLVASSEATCTAWSHTQRRPMGINKIWYLCDMGVLRWKMLKAPASAAHPSLVCIWAASHPLELTGRLSAGPVWWSGWGCPAQLDLWTGAYGGLWEVKGFVNLLFWKSELFNNNLKRKKLPLQLQKECHMKSLFISFWHIPYSLLQCNPVL